MNKLLVKFDSLMSHLNGEDNSMAASFRKALEEKIESASDDELWRECLEAGGVDNWEGFSESLCDGGYHTEEEDE